MRSTDLAVRIDDDKFALVVDDVEPSDARALANRLFEAVGESGVDSDKEMILEFNIGLMQLKDSYPCGNWLKRAQHTAW